VKVNLDRTSSGFCIGVQGTIYVAEEKLLEHGGLYSFGDVVHNEVEVKRLEDLGLITVDETAFKELKNAQVLIRAHGEPPATYRIARENNLTITDTTCPVVSRLQRTTRMLYKLGYQIIIYGKQSHPEVIGINGQCDNNAVIIKHADLSYPEEIKAVLISRSSPDMFSPMLSRNSGRSSSGSSAMSASVFALIISIFEPDASAISATFLV